MGYKSDAQRKAVHASKAEKSPAKKKLIGNQDKLPEELKAKIKAAPEMKGSPYMMYGKEMSPMTMKGGSPLAKYGSSKKYNKSPLKADTPTKGMTVANADLETLKKWKSNPEAVATMNAKEISVLNTRIKELSNK